MDCKNCGNQLPEEETTCLQCGNDNSEPIEPAYAEEEITQQQEGIADDEPVSVPKKRKVWQVILTAGVCLLLLIAMALVVISGTGKTEEGKRPVNRISDMLSVFRTNDIYCRSTFSVEESKALKKADDVVATIGDYTLTNGQLQIFYWTQISNFQSNYGKGYFDTTRPLAEQYYSEEDNLSWEQYFLDIAIESWSRYVMLNILAEADGLSLTDEEYTTIFDKSVEEEAVKYGFASGEEMVDAYYGAACSKADYINYIRLYEVALSYFEKQYEAYVPTEQQISDFYDNNKAAFEASGLKKEDKTVVDVRHILIRLEEPKPDSYGKVNYTDDQWEQCRVEAQKILDKYFENPTEDNFGALAKEYSEDGSANVGGLYSDVEAGQMVAEFNDWIFDKGRKAGDTGLVKTVYGYHVMYFVSTDVTVGDWYEIAKTQVSSEYMNGLIDMTAESNPMEVSYKKIAIADVPTAE